MFDVFWMFFFSHKSRLLASCSCDTFQKPDPRFTIKYRLVTIYLSCMKKISQVTDAASSKNGCPIDWSTRNLFGVCGSTRHVAWIRFFTRVCVYTLVCSSVLAERVLLGCATDWFCQMVWGAGGEEWSMQHSATWHKEDLATRVPTIWNVILVNRPVVLTKIIGFWDRSLKNGGNQLGTVQILKCGSRMTGEILRYERGVVVVLVSRDFCS